MSKNEIYALWHEKEGILLSVFAEPNTGDCCNDNSYELSMYDDNIWAVYDFDIAEKASKTSEPWYNSSYEKPINPYTRNCKVVRLEIVEFY
jgi:hypothetical protein